MPEDFKTQLRDMLAETLKHVPPEERVKGLPPEERLKGLPPEEQLKALSPQALDLLARKLKADDSSSGGQR